MSSITVKRSVLCMFVLALFTSPAAGTAWNAPKKDCPMSSPSCTIYAPIWPYA